MPAKYSAVEQGQVASIRNQASWGTCWSFSALAAAESAYIKLNGKEANLSESHLVNFFYNDAIDGPDGGLTGDAVTAVGDKPVQRGGNSLFTTWGMARWTGIADEATDASLVYPSNTAETNELSIDSQFAYTDAMHLENAYWINLDDKDSVKKAVMEYGAVGVSYYYDAYYDSDYYKYYMNADYDGPAVYYNPYSTSTNHAVAIVGWDDNFDRNNFQYTYDNAYWAEEGWEAELPSKNGAWLIRNSWGSGIGDGGYFWISYEDASISPYSYTYEGKTYTATRTAFAFDFDIADNYDHNYQYDGSAGTKAVSGSNLTAAAVYTVNGETGSTQAVSAVGVGFASASTSYTVKIYTDLKDVANPESGTLAATKKGKTSFEGYYTIELDEPIFVDAGENFGVVVIASKGSGKASLFVDTSYTNSNWIKFTANTDNDKTFYKSGSKWVDAGSAQDYTFRIKAFTDDIDTTAKAADKVIVEDMVGEIAPVTYTGAAATPEPKVVFDGVTLTKGTDYILTYSDNDKVGTAKVTINGTGSYTGTVEKTFTISQKAMTADMISVSGWTYDGENHNTLSVKNGNVVMTETTDYKVKYSKDPVNAGKYTVTVTGTGNYKGKASKTFNVNKYELTAGSVTLAYDTVEYNGKDNKPAVTVKIGNFEVPSSNYSVSYKNNKAAGTAQVIVKGKNNCSGTVEKTFTISTKSVATEGISATVGNGLYTGSEVKPQVTLKDGSTKLKLGKDYTVEYSNNINATTESSKAYAIIKGTGNYSGSMEVPFDISVRKATKIAVEAYVQKDGSSVCVVKADGKTVNEADFTINNVVKAGTSEQVAVDKMQAAEKYDVEVELKNNYSGVATVKNVLCKKDMNAITVAFTAQDETYTYSGKAIKPAIQVKDGENTVAAKNYTVKYTDNINAGTATVEVIAKGNTYAGTAKLQFTIQKKNVDATLKLSNIKDTVYTGNEIAPSLTVKDGSKTLKKGTDYTLVYANNKNVSYENNEVAAKASVEVKLSDNYTVSNEEVCKTYFKIKPASINKVTVAAAYFKGENNAVEPSITVKAGKIDVPASAYDVTWTDNTKVTTKAKVKVTAKENANFTGSKEVTFKIVKEPLSKATISGVADSVYPGKAVEFSGIVLKDSENQVIDASNYTISYKNNTKVGNATVIITAKSDSIYSGSVSKKFKITKAELSDLVKITGSLETKSYTGKKITYTTNEIAEVVKAAVEGDKPAYTVSYSNNINAGTATMILKGKGNYQGEVQLTFTINPCDIKDAVIKAEKKVQYNNGQPVYAKVNKVTIGKTTLSKGKDYTVSYASTTNKGLGVIKVTGTGNYTGTKLSYYVIK